MKWLACDMHTHTLHSDGRATVPVHLQGFKKRLLDVIALTDHNTQSGLFEVTPELEAETVRVIRGIEWTTYFGHVLVYGTNKYVDWRTATPDNIDEKLAEVRAADGVCGVAHPYVVGDPICCGCGWEFKLKDWSLPHFIEIWSSPSPQFFTSNKHAYDKWIECLDKGIRLVGVASSDWHGPHDDKNMYGTTYIYMDKDADITEQAKQAIRGGKVYVSMAHNIDLTATSGGKSGTIGDTLPSGDATISVTFTEDHRKEIWQAYGIVPEKIYLHGNGNKVVAEWDFKLGETYTAELKDLSGWLKCELHGQLQGANKALTITNPIYFN